MIKISVVTVTYNCETTLEETIRSVIDQSYIGIEYIIIDGASSDGTLNIINKYKHYISYFVSEQDCGIYDAMNKAISVATGDFVIFMNAGDSFYSKDTLKEFIPRITPQTDIAYGNIIKVAKGFKYLEKPEILEHMSDKMIVFHQATFTRLSYHKENLFDLSYKSAADYNFFYKAYLVDHACFQYIDIPVANFDCSDGTSNVHFKQSQRENMHIRGVAHDFSYRLKKELWFVTIDLKRWIKKNFLSREKIRQIEIAQVKRNGITEIKLIPFK